MSFGSLKSSFMYCGMWSIEVSLGSAAGPWFIESISAAWLKV